MDEHSATIYRMRYPFLPNLNFINRLMEDGIDVVGSVADHKQCRAAGRYIPSASKISAYISKDTLQTSKLITESMEMQSPEDLGKQRAALACNRCRTLKARCLPSDQPGLCLK